LVVGFEFSPSGLFRVFSGLNTHLVAASPRCVLCPTTYVVFSAPSAPPRENSSNHFKPDQAISSRIKLRSRTEAFSSDFGNLGNQRQPVQIASDPAEDYPELFWGSSV
jgi:hypothetical protein